MIYFEFLERNFKFINFFYPVIHLNKRLIIHIHDIDFINVQILFNFFKFSNYINLLFVPFH